MNRIVEASINEFATQFDYKTLSNEAKFEKFCNYSISTKEIPQLTITKEIIDDINIGSGNDWGIDGLMILINKRPISTIAEIRLLKDMELKVDIILIQAKTSDSINVGELGKTMEGARNIIRYLEEKTIRNSLPPANPDLKDKLALLDALYECPSLGSDMDSSRPRLKIFYCVGGQNGATKDHEALCSATKNDIDSKMLTVDNTCEILSSTDLIKIYKGNRTRIQNTITIDSGISFPSNMEGISEGYLCLVSFPEFKKLILIPGEHNVREDKIIKEIFEDNVRDFQGDNPVNNAIAKSIKDGNSKLFAVLNNGITIIARKGSLKGKLLNLQDYQIVNGCQTCHVLFENRTHPEIEDLMLTIKVIFSTDQNIRDKIVVANNYQTQVMREQLTSLLDTQKTIEYYYQAVNKFVKLYFERRSKQYKYGEEKIPAERIITIPAQLMAYVSMVLGKPHMTSHYYGVLLEEFNGKDGKEKIIDPDANPAFYYTSALAAYKRDRLLSDGSLPRAAKYVKHHLLHAFPLVASDKSRPRLNSNSAEAYCDELCTVLCDSEKCKETFEKAYRLIVDTLKRTPRSTDLNDSSLADEITRHFHVSKTRQKSVKEDNISVVDEDSDVFRIQTESIRPKIKVIGTIDLDKIGDQNHSRRFGRKKKDNEDN